MPVMSTIEKLSRGLPSDETDDQCVIAACHQGLRLSGIRKDVQLIEQKREYTAEKTLQSHLQWLDDNAPADTEDLRSRIIWLLAHRDYQRGYCRYDLTDYPFERLIGAYASGPGFYGTHCGAEYFTER
jgi:hypothetical protein